MILDAKPLPDWDWTSSGPGFLLRHSLRGLGPTCRLMRHDTKFALWRLFNEIQSSGTLSGSRDQSNRTSWAELRGIWTSYFLTRICWRATKRMLVEMPNCCSRGWGWISTWIYLMLWTTLLFGIMDSVTVLPNSCLEHVVIVRIIPRSDKLSMCSVRVAWLQTMNIGWNCMARCTRVPCKTNDSQIKNDRSP